MDISTDKNKKCSLDSIIVLCGHQAAVMAGVEHQTKVPELQTELQPEEKTGVLFEDVLDIINPYGLAQGIMIMFSIVVDLIVCYATFFFVFEGANPGFICHDPIEANMTAGNETWSRALNVCPKDRGMCENVTYRDALTSIVTEWNLICTSSYYPKLTTSIYFGGVLIGSMLGALADYVGRKRLVMVTWIGLCVFQASLGLATSYTTYVVLKIITGIFAGTSACVATTLPMEYVGPDIRHIVATRMGWRVGFLTLPLIGYLIRPWRWLAFACGVITAVFIPLAFFIVPESARWYIQRGEYDAAMKQITWVAKLNRRPVPDMVLLKAVGGRCDSANGKSVYSVLDLFATRQFATRTCTQMFAWCTVSMVAYGITSEISSLTGSIYLNLFLSGLFNFIIRLTTIYTMQRFGRRICFLVYMILPTVMCFVVTILDVTGAMQEIVRTVLAVSLFAVLTGTWSALFAFAQEVYPTLLRNTSTSTFNTSSRIGGILAPQIAYLGVFHRSIPYIVFGTLGVVTVVSVFMVMPETKDTPLREDLPMRTRKPSHDATSHRG